MPVIPTASSGTSRSKHASVRSARRHRRAGRGGFWRLVCLSGRLLAKVPVVGSYVSAPPTHRRGRGPGRARSLGTADRRGRHGQDRAHRRDPRGRGHDPCLRIHHRDRQDRRRHQRDRLHEGQKVITGQTLVQLDAAERKAEIEQAAAEANRAVALRNEVQIKLERALALNRTGAGTGAQVEDLTAQVKSLEGALASAQAQRKAAEARLEDLTIRAPFAGRVGTRSVSSAPTSRPERASRRSTTSRRSAWTSRSPRTS